MDTRQADKNIIDQILKSHKKDLLGMYGRESEFTIMQTFCGSTYSTIKVSPLEYIFYHYFLNYPPRHDDHYFELSPQYKVGKYKIDFLVKLFIIKNDMTGDPIASTFVELDGFAYHDRNREQFDYERERQNEIIKTGIPLLRFTYKRITTDMGGIAKELFDICFDV